MNVNVASAKTERLGGGPTGDEKVLQDLVGSDEERPLRQGQTDATKLTGVQIRKAATVIPANYCNINCWIYRLEGHSTFICPYLTADKLLYFSYRYFLDQLQANRQISKYLEENMQWHLSNYQVKSGFAAQLLQEIIPGPTSVVMVW